MYVSTVTVTIVREKQRRRLRASPVRGKATTTRTETLKNWRRGGHTEEYALLQLTWRRVHTHTHRRRISPTRGTLPHPARKRQRARATVASYTRTRAQTLEPALRHGQTERKRTRDTFCVHACMYIYIYMYVCTRTHTHTHTYAH